MKNRLWLILTCAGIAAAQTPNFSGVWKADLTKSKLNGPPLKNYLVLIEQDGSKLTETVEMVGERGGRRSSFTYDLGGKPSLNTSGGLPMQTLASVDGAKLKLESKVAAIPHPGTMSEIFVLSTDGKTLTIESSSKIGTRDQQQLAVLEKQPDAAGEELRKPEELAGAHYKNVLLLKDLPESKFIETMRYFAASLGVECNHCHVQTNFAADDKPTKVLARKMIQMAHTDNEEFLKGLTQVQCYTCHRGQAKPQVAPAFE